MKRLLAWILTLSLCLGSFGLAWGEEGISLPETEPVELVEAAAEAPAQEPAPAEEASAPEVTAAPTEVPTEVPTEASTAAPVEAPTEAPTAEHVPEVTEAPAETETPAEETAAPAATEVPAAETEAPAETTETPVSTEEPAAEATDALESTETPVAQSTDAPESTEVPEAEATEAPAVEDEPFTLVDGELQRYLGDERAVTLPEGVRAIGQRAFAGNTTLEEITLPASLETIEAEAFLNCVNLRKVTVQGTALQVIRQAAFQGCAALTDHSFADQVPGVAADAFGPVAESSPTAAPTETPVPTAPPTNPESEDGEDEGEDDDRSIYATIVAHPVSVKVGHKQRATFKVEASGWYLSYQWQTWDSAKRAWGNTGLAGNQTDTLSFDAPYSFNGRSYRCVVTDIFGRQAISNTAYLTVVDPPYIYYHMPYSLKVSVDAGETASMTVYVSDSSVKYQWQTSVNNGKTWGNTGLSGNQTNNLRFKAVADFNGRLYRCLVTDQWGGVTISSTFTLTVAKGNLRISKQPSAVKVGSNSTATFTVEAVGNGLKYQWQTSVNDGKTWGNTGLSGNQTAKLSFDAPYSFNGRMYRCVVQDSAGNSVISNEVKLTVITSDLKITKQPGSVTVGEKVKATFTVATSGSWGVSYQWQTSVNGGKTWGDTGLNGAKTTTLSFNATSTFNGRMYRCRVRDYYGVTVYSSAVTLKVVPCTLKITTQPTSQAVKCDNWVTFTVTAGSTGSSRVSRYQWQTSVNGGQTWGDTGLSGNSTAKLSFIATANFNGRMYRCAVYDQWGSVVYSNGVSLTVIGSGNPKYRALLVGNGRYYDGSNLSGPPNDVSAMRGMLTGLKTPFSVTVKQNLTASQILSAISSTLGSAGPNDVSLFYYSGHGLDGTGTGNMGALCGVGLNYISNDIVTFAQLANALNKVQGKVIVILDSCHSGAAISSRSAGGKNEIAYEDFDPVAFNSSAISAFAGYTISESYVDAQNKAAELRQSKFVVLTACTYSQSSVEMLISGYRRGLFTDGVVKALGCTYPNGGYGGSMPGDSNQDKLITLGELYSYAKSYCSRYHTVMSYGDSGYVLFRRK